MIKTNIILVRQEFAIIPSTFSEAELSNSTITMVDEETKEEYVYGPVNDIIWEAGAFDWDDEARNWEFDQTTAEEGWYFTRSEDENYLIITLLSKIGLKEGAIYSVEIKNNTTVIYRDTMFVSSKGSKVEVYSYPDNYVPLSGSTGYTVI